MGYCAPKNRVVKVLAAEIEQIQEIRALLGIPKTISIISHRNPDGDAIGSSLGLAHFLLKLGHTVHVLCPSEYPDFLSWMPKVKDILIYDIDPEGVERALKHSDIVFCLDFNALDRIDKAGEIINNTENQTTILIDHHLYPENFTDFLLSDATASSTSEMVYDFILALGYRNEMDAIIGDALYTGIVTDTGSFKYGTSPKVFRIVAELLEIGVDDYLLQDLIFNCMQEKQLRLLGHCLYNRMEILEEYKTGIITLTKEDYAQYDIQRGDTEGIVNYLLKLRDVKLAALITEQPTIVKVSLRSKGEFSVQEIAKKHFKGGGHKNASGGYSFQTLEITVNRFKKALPFYKDALQRLS